MRVKDGNAPRKGADRARADIDRSISGDTPDMQHLDESIGGVAPLGPEDAKDPAGETRGTTESGR
ncbi:hypothetical protein [Sphingomonas sp.]|uniref:hypothetical protein n=1 Tax=Sphingomonas sp. TaxID=28214 RepID=UPI001EBB5026|nr:hypothetical protein [Sphingomonas sp.]MBX3595206.1 hypothetical protein [Sphingomonas sp.]